MKKRWQASLLHYWGLWLIHNFSIQSSATSCDEVVPTIWQVQQLSSVRMKWKVDATGYMCCKGSTGPWPELQPWPWKSVKSGKLSSGEWVKKKAWMNRGETRLTQFVSHSLTQHYRDAQIFLWPLWVYLQAYHPHLTILCFVICYLGL
jgi:hypothetical protein